MSFNDQNASFSVNKSQSGSKYSYQYYSPTDVLGTITLAASAPTRTSWQLQSGSFMNLCRSFLVGDLVGAVAAAKETHQALLIDKPPIDRIRLLCNNVAIADISNADIFSKGSRMYCSRLEDYLANPPVLNTSGTLAASGHPCRFFQPAGVPLAANAANTRYAGYIDTNGKTTGTTASSTAGPLNAVLSNQVVLTSTQSAAPPTQAESIYTQMRLILGECWPDSFFGLDKTIYLPGIVTLEVYWCGYTQQTTNVAAANVATLESGGDISGLSITGLQLALAIEMDDGVKNKLREDFAKGYEMFIPYPINNGPTNLGASTQVTVSYPLNVGSGRALLRVWNMFSGAATNGLLSGNLVNVAGSRVTGIRTQLGQVYFQPGQILATNAAGGTNGYSTMYDFQRPLVKESALPEGERSFYRQFLHLDNFIDSEPIARNFNSKLERASGVPLFPQPVSYNIEVAKPAAAQILYQWFIMQKLLSITSTGVNVS